MHESCIKISANFSIFPGSNFKEWKDVDSTYGDVLQQILISNKKVLFESYIKQLQYVFVVYIRTSPVWIFESFLE